METVMQLLQASYLWRWMRDGQRGLSVFITTARGGITFWLAISLYTALILQTIVKQTAVGQILAAFFSAATALVAVFIAQLLLAPARMDKARVVEVEVAEQKQREVDQQLQELHRRQEDRSELGRLLLEGNAIKCAAWKLLDIDNDTEGLQTSVSVTTEKCEAWVAAVVDYLEDAHPGWTALFLDETYPHTQYMASSRADRCRICNWMDRRLYKLGNLMSQLGPASQGIVGILSS